MSTTIDLKGQHFKYWEVLEYVGDKKWKCKCTCGKIRILRKYDLAHLGSNVCPHQNTYKEDLTNKEFGEWKVIKYIKHGYWLCRCSCGQEKEVKGTHLLSGASKSCGHSTTGIKDLTDQKFNDWEVIKYVGHSKWLCRCSCGRVEEVLSEDLRTRHSKSCGHNTNQFIDLTNKRFGNWVVKRYVGKLKWECECQCEKHTIQYIDSYDLRAGNTKSCGCMSHELKMITMKNKYSEVYAQRKDNPREDWQIEALQNRDKMLSIIQSNNEITPGELGDILGVGISTILRTIHKFKLEKYIKIYQYSSEENELYETIKNMYSGNIIRKDRNILKGKEIDIYIPDRRLAIEFNGNYWHSDYNKNKTYHQDKTIECIKQNIRLIHIFEYEYKDIQDKLKMQRFLKDLLCDKQIIYARNTQIYELNTEEERQFLEKHHLQGYVSSSIRIGLKYNEEIVGIMTFGHPRFNSNYQYELIRLCYKSGVSIVGGSEKMLKYFIEKYSITNIISYCNLSKFDGNGYLRLGFKTDISMLTKPNYVWVESNNNTVLKRYKTQKQKLLDKGLGEYGNTEDEIMRNLGYLKIYDSGNMKFTWERR